MASPATFRAVVIDPTLDLLAEFMPPAVASEDAKVLMLRTAMMESGLEHTVQLNSGPARGFFQVEPKWGAKVLWASKVGPSIWEYFIPPRPHGFLVESEAIAPHLELNPFFCCAVARLFYWEDPKPIPPADDLNAQFFLWLRQYNRRGVTKHMTESAALGKWRLCAERCA